MSPSRQFDIAIDIEFEINASSRNDRPGRQCGAGQSSLRIGVANRLLDLSLGSDTDLPEELAYAGAEGRRRPIALLSASSRRILAPPQRGISISQHAPSGENVRLTS